MSDPGTNRGSLPAFAIVIAVILGILVLVLVIFLFINRNKEGSYTSRLLHRRKPTADSMRKTIYPLDESNPRRPSNVPPRVQPTAYNPPGWSPSSGPPHSGRIRHEESESLLPTHVNQAFVPREMELRHQMPHVDAGHSQFSGPRPPRGILPKPAGLPRPSLYPTSIAAAGGYAR